MSHVVFIGGDVEPDAAALGGKGDGLAFLHASGHLEEVRLGAGESLRVDTGCLESYGSY